METLEDREKLIKDRQIVTHLDDNLSKVYIKEIMENGIFDKETTNKLLEYSHSFDDQYLQYEYYLQIIKHSNTLIVEDINGIVSSLVNNPTIINTVELISAIEENYSHLSEGINFIPLVNKMMDFLAAQTYYDDTLKWMELNYNVGRFITENLILRGRINHFIHALNNIDALLKKNNNSGRYYLLLRGKKKLLRTLNCNGDVFTLDDFLDYYKLSGDLMIGVNV